MKSFLVVFAVLSTVVMWSQSTVLRGKIVDANDLPIENAHIQNLHSHRYTTTDRDGRFSIEAIPGNVLQITHVSMQTVVHKVQQNDFRFAGITIGMQEQITDLEGVEVSKYQKISSKDLGIIQQDIVQLTFNEKRLIAATKNEGIVLRMVNAISGRTRMLKTIVANERNLGISHYIQENFSDFLKKELKVNDEDVELLSYFVMEKPDFHQAVNNQQNETLRFMLIDAWLEYQNVLKQADKELEKEDNE
ncbi:MAG: carboxypeptidase-like regulatory domain-containing protein [Capnocytophaga sp.]|nr:carboxypeptidase-like regulatory domain-containing protein [Capnocytophaga sp.]